MIKLLLLIIHIFCAILLIMVVLVQQSKGAGLASVFGGGAAEDILGVRGAPTFFQKLTWILVSIFMLTALLSAVISPRRMVVKKPVIESKIEEMMKLKPLQEEKEEAPFEFPQEEKK